MIFKPDFSKRLKQSFYLRDPILVAKDLLGMVIVKKENEDKYLASIIIETEAYLSDNDYASHSSVGKTIRNRAMFERGGIAYVYLIYGIHHCFNIVTEEENIGSAILIRSAIPILGYEIMKRRRNESSLQKLCNGPGNFGKSYNFNLSHNLNKVFNEYLFIQSIGLEEEISQCIISTPRIGIKKSVDLPLRFVIKNEKFLFQKYLPNI